MPRLLAAECVAIDATLEPHLRATAPLTEYAWRYRYPGEPFEPEESEVRQALDRHLTNSTPVVSDGKR